MLVKYIAVSRLGRKPKEHQGEMEGKREENFDIYQLTLLKK